MNEIRNIIVEEISRMLDNPDKYGIYPTGMCYDHLEYKINDYINNQLQAYKDKEDKLIKWCYEHGQAINATDILDIIDPTILKGDK